MSMTSAQIRRQFLDFFIQKHGHTFVASSPVVPVDDPTLLFANAGMNQFKPIFLGQEKRLYTRAANTQKCIRAGGKHNDLDDVGRSRRHHTFFEMLGNWSFGDYFKRGAIEMAWELLTKVWELDPTRLHVSCYEGDEKNNIPRDTEAAELWKEIAGMPDDHIHYFGSDNFWLMGDTGPCGPCTEIYIDRTPDKSGGKQVNGDDPRVMEIWNLVFIQFNRDAAGKLTPLPAQHVDTGMGFERICQVLQGKEDNYAIDLWTPLFEKISEISDLKYVGKFPPTNAPDPAQEAADQQLRHDIAFRVVADHARCLTFALTDGAVPSNEGRGYVLRRILRRAVRFGRQQLGLTEPFLHRLVPVVVDSMGEAFPELKRNPKHVADLIKDEEMSFSRTLDRGIALFEHAAADAIARAYQATFLPHMVFAGTKTVGFWEGEPAGEINAWKDSATELNFVERDGPRPINIRTDSALSRLRKEGMSARISAEKAFNLYDTFGFPIDLTRIMAEERGMSVDIAGYEKLMDEARELARGVKRASEGRVYDLNPQALDKLREDVQPTNDSPKFTLKPIRGVVKDIWDGNELVALATPSKDYAVILDRTNFYAEMGGQVGDSGTLKTANGVFEVKTTKLVGGYVLHIGQVQSGKIFLGDEVEATVSPVRDRTEKNHTGTHLANWALRETLGDGVQQKGSLVDPEKLRFDFSHSKSMSEEEIGRVEDLVNQAIAQKLPVFAEEAPQESALKINGLRAMFGEKYPSTVRVVSIGAPVKDLLANPGKADWRKFSIEFCGGTHLASTDQIGRFAITSEESVSKGIRRIVALTGEAAAGVQSAGDRLDSAIARARQAAEAELPGILAELQSAVASPIPLRTKRRAQAAIAELQAKYRAFEKSAKSQSSGGGVDAVKAAGDLAAKSGGKLVIGEIAGATDDQLRSAIDSLRKKLPSHAIMLAAHDGQKVTFIAAVSDDLVAKGLKAGDWVKQVAAVAGGGGGGRPQMAQGSGKDPSKIADALDKAKQIAGSIADNATAS